MATDDGMRADSGVVACIRNIPGGKMRVIFDDVKSDRTTKPKQWKHQVVFKWHEFDRDKLVNLELSEKEFAVIGQDLLIRLLALDGDLQ